MWTFQAAYRTKDRTYSMPDPDNHEKDKYTEAYVYVSHIRMEGTEALSMEIWKAADDSYD